MNGEIAAINRAERRLRQNAHCIVACGREALQSTIEPKGYWEAVKLCSAGVSLHIDTTEKAERLLRLVAVATDVFKLSEIAAAKRAERLLRRGAD